MLRRITAGDRLRKKAKKGFRGYPVGTLAFYGPDDERATELVAGIIDREGGEPVFLEKWYSERDVRRSEELLHQAAVFFEEHRTLTVVMPDRIIGCPHEEGIDYEGPTCPKCPFWAGRDRCTDTPVA